VTHYNFQKDLSGAQKDLNIMAREICKVYNCTIVEEGSKTNKWDFVLSSSKNPFISIEMKSDYMGYTGNFALEFESRGKPSGISVTQASYWLNWFKYKDKPNVAWMFPVSALRKMISDELYHRTVSGGDVGSNTKMYLFKHSILSDFGWKLDLTV